MVDWPAFFDAHRIDYVTSGANIARGNIGIRCPFCIDDPSQHMSVSTEGKGWFCRRNREHSGRSPVRLIVALIGCSSERARELAGLRALPDDFMVAVRDRLSPDVSPPQASLIMPDEFLPLRDVVSARPYLNYLRGRGFSDGDIWRLVKRFDLRYCREGPFVGRIIFPVVMHGELMSWTGRTVVDDPVRYKAREGKPPINDYLLWHDQIVDSGADTFYLVEGPFDAAKIWALGYRYGIVATCVFTGEPSASQISLLHELLPLFKNRFLLLDQNAVATTLRVAMRSGLDLTPRYLTVKDPGELRDVGFLLP